MNSMASPVRKTCKSCLEDVKTYITCSKCDSTYHIYCLNKVPGAYVSPQGQLFCCRNITPKYDVSRKILRTQDEPFEKVIKEESLDDCTEDLDNCLPDEDCEQNKFKCKSCYLEFTNQKYLEGHYGECPYIIQGGLIQEIKRDTGLENCSPDVEDCEQNMFKCEPCYLEFTNKEHLEGHFGECPYNIQGGLIQGIKRDKDFENCLLKDEDLEWNKFKCGACLLEFPSKEHLKDHYNKCFNKEGESIQELKEEKDLDNCLHKEEDLEWSEFKCDACSLELTNEEDLENHYRECPDKQRELLQELYKNKVDLVCSFCNEANFQEESYEQHVKQCQEYYSQLHKVNDVCITSMKRKKAHIHTNEQIFKCNKCRYATKRRHFLKYHILSKHCEGKKGSSHIEYSLERHMRTHTNQKPFKCNRCDYRTALKGPLKIHMKVKHSKVEKEYKCGKCKYSTYKEQNLVDHIRIHTKERPFKCDSCDFTTSWKPSLRSHILAKHSNRKKKYKCSDCKYSTHQKWTLVRHMCVHTNEKPFKCDICNYASTRKVNLNDHILAKHSNVEKKYKCNDCKYATHLKASLVTHTRIHTNEKPYKCDTCNYATTRSSHLNSHILAKHSNAEKMYKCSDCEYSTHQKACLARHIRRTHSNEKPFKCDTCNYAATQKANLDYHILAKHSNAEKQYKCSDCKYSAHQKSKLNSHIAKKHSKTEKKCTVGSAAIVCKYSAYTKLNLEHRMHTQTNEGPFKCDSCDYVVAQRSTLISHILVKHSNPEDLRIIPILQKRVQ